MGHNTKIDVDPISGVVASAYRQLHPTGNSGTLDGMTGIWEEDFDYETIIINIPGTDLGARYPTSYSFDGYAFGFTINILVVVVQFLIQFSLYTVKMKKNGHQELRLFLQMA